MIYQASFLDECPHQILSQVFGSIYRYEENGQTIYVTEAFSSLEQLKRLCGTVQSRLERQGMPFTGAIIQPHNVKPATQKGRYLVSGPLKCKLDYGLQNKLGDPKEWEEVPQRNPFYDRFAADELRSSETMMIAANEYYSNGLTKANVVDYYKQVAPFIIREYAQHDIDSILLVQVDDGVVVRRHASHEMLAMQADPGVFAKLNRGRAVEFRFAARDTTKLMWLDLDPQKDFPWEDTKKVASELADLMASLETVNVLDIQIRFSGTTGFHIVGMLAHKIQTTEANAIMKALAKAYVDQRKDDRLTTKAIGESNTMRIWHQARELRIPYSLVYTTGLVCLPLTRGELKIFQKHQATTEGALAKIRLEKRGQDEIGLMPLEREAFEKVLGVRKGEVTGGDLRNVIRIYDEIRAETSSDDPAYGEKKWVKLLRDITGDSAMTPDTAFKFVDSLKWLSESPKYFYTSVNKQANGQMNGHPSKLPPMTVPLEDIAQKVEPEIEQLSEETIKFLVDLPGRVSPTEIRKFIKVMLGFEVPLEKVNEFIDRLKLMVSARYVAYDEFKLKLTNSEYPGFYSFIKLGNKIWRMARK